MAFVCAVPQGAAQTDNKKPAVKTAGFLLGVRLKYLSLISL